MMMSTKFFLGNFSDKKRGHAIFKKIIFGNFSFQNLGTPFYKKIFPKFLLLQSGIRYLFNIPLTL